MLPLLAAGAVLNAIRLQQGSALGMVFIDWRGGFFYFAGFAAFVQLCGFVLGVTGRRSWGVRLFLLLMCLCVWRFCTPTLLIERLVLWTMGWETQVRLAFWMARNGGRFLDMTVFFALLLAVLRPLLQSWDLRPERRMEAFFLRKASLPAAVFCLLLLNRVAGHIRPVLL